VAPFSITMSMVASPVPPKEKAVLGSHGRR
jgi:hypothetical protein